MPFEISKLPRGLTGLLSLRDQGATPRLLADQVVAIIDATPMFLLDVRELPPAAVQLAPAVGVNQYSAPIVVPAGEIWYVWHYTVVGAPGAGAAIRLAPSIQPDGLPLNMVLAPYQSAAALEEVRVAAQNFWAPAGTIFTFLAQSVTLAPRVDGALIVTKLRV